MTTPMEDHTIEWGKRVIIADLSEDDALTYFRFRKKDLQDLANKLWPRLMQSLGKDPGHVVVKNRYTPKKHHVGAQQHQRSAIAAPKQRKSSTTTAPKQHKSSTTAAQHQHHSSTKAAPQQHHSSNKAATQQHQKSAKAASKQRQSGAKAAPQQHQSSTKAAQK